MSIILKALLKVFGKKQQILEVEIKFHKEANLYGRHGTIKASHKEQKLEGYPVRFVFKGLSTPPALTPNVLQYIWEEAKAQGYNPEEMLSYGEVLPTHNELDHNDVVSQERKDAENRFHDSVSDRMPARTQQLAQADVTNELAQLNRFSKHTTASGMSGGAVVMCDMRSTSRSPEKETEKV